MCRHIWHSGLRGGSYGVEHHFQQYFSYIIFRLEPHSCDIFLVGCIAALKTGIPNCWSPELCVVLSCIIPCHVSFNTKSVWSGQKKISNKLAEKPQLVSSQQWYRPNLVNDMFSLHTICFCFSFLYVSPMSTPLISSGSHIHIKSVNGRLFFIKAWTLWNRFVIFLYLLVLLASWNFCLNSTPV
jgi:hypothetical protein